MATLVVGDVQGCYRELRALLGEAGFRVGVDQLWLLGDLVNRGPDSLAVLRFVADLGDRALVTLGNHDLHLLAVALGGHRAMSKDTFNAVLESPDCAELCYWLRHQPLLHYAAEFNAMLVHAGVPHIWSLEQLRREAAAVEKVITGVSHTDYFAQMYGNSPAGWNSDLEGMPRWRASTNYLTRMRLINAAGELEFRQKGAPEDLPPGFFPWFQRRHASVEGMHVLFGHWASLDGRTNHNEMIALDTGCVWGRTLTGYRLEDNRRFQVRAQ